MTEYSPRQLALIEDVEAMKAKGIGEAEIKRYADAYKRGATDPSNKTALVRILSPIAQGATFGWGDELSAWVNDKLGRSDYYTELGFKRGAAKAVGDDHPVWNIAGQVAGAAPLALLSGPLEAVLAARGIGLGGRAAVEAIGGGIGGGVQGAGDANEGNRMEGAAYGAAVGGVAAPIIGTAARMVGAGIGAAAPTVAAGRRLNDIVQRVTTPPGVPRDVPQLAKGNMMRPEAQGNIVLGESLNGAGLDELERLAQTAHGEAPDIVNRALLDQTEGSQRRLIDQAHGLAPTNEGPTAFLQRMTEQQRTGAGTQYQALIGQPLTPEYRQVVEAFLSTPNGRAAYNAAARNQQNIIQAAMTRRRTDPSVVVPAPFPQTPGFDPRALARQLDQDQAERIMQQLKSARDSGLVQGPGIGEATVQADNIGAALQAGANDPLAPPATQAARAAYAEPARLKDALTTGVEAFQGRSARDFRAWVAGLSPAERDAVRTGVADHLAVRVGSRARGSLTDYTRLLTAPETAEKIAALLDPADARQWQRLVENERRVIANAQRVTSNSATARRLAQQEDANRSAILDMLERGGLGGGWVQNLLRGVGRIGRKGVSLASKRRDAALARILTLTDPDDAERALRRALAAGRVLQPMGDVRTGILGSTGAVEAWGTD